MIKIIFVLFGLLFAQVTQAGVKDGVNWKQFSVDKDMVVYIDTNSLDRVGNEATALFLINMPNIKPDSSTPASTEVVVKFDCLNHRNTTIGSGEFSDHMGDGTAAYSKSKNEKWIDDTGVNSNQQWEYQACSAKIPDDIGWQQFSLVNRATSQVVMYIDTASVKRTYIKNKDGANEITIATATLLMDFPKHSDNSTPSSVTEEIKYDCQNHRSALIRLVEYGNHMGTGTMIDSKDFPDNWTNDNASHEKESEAEVCHAILQDTYMMHGASSQEVLTTCNHAEELYFTAEDALWNGHTKEKAYYDVQNRYPEMKYLMIKEWVDAIYKDGPIHAKDDTAKDKIIFERGDRIYNKCLIMLGIPSMVGNPNPYN